MSDFRNVYSTIRSKLAHDYWDPNYARVLIQDAQIDANNIQLQEKPIVFWNDILIQAIREKKIEDLLGWACSGKPGLEDLRTQFLRLLPDWDHRFGQITDAKLPFPLNQSFDEIVDAIAKGILVPVLGPSINPAIYNDLSARLVELLVQADFQNDPQVADEKVSRAREKKKFVKTYYGSLCTICHFLPALVPSECPLLVIDLRLMSSLNDVSGIPTEGKNLIIVAAVNNVLHFRIFDDDGKVVVDTDEKRLTEQVRQIEDLRERLKSLWPPYELTTIDKGRVITAVTSIVDHTHVDTSVYDEQMLSVAKTNCRSLSQLYLLKHGPASLYDNIKQSIIDASVTVNPIHHVLARLLKEWPELSAARKPDQVTGGEPAQRPALPFSLIITSNCDVGLEREFEKARIPYDLLWCVAAGRNQGKWMYMPYERKATKGKWKEGPIVSHRRADRYSFRQGSEGYYHQNLWNDQGSVD